MSKKIQIPWQCEKCGKIVFHYHELDEFLHPPHNKIAYFGDKGKEMLYCLRCYDIWDKDWRAKNPDAVLMA